MHSNIARSLQLLLLTSCFLCGCNSSGERKLSAEEKQKMIEIHTESAQQYLAMGELDRAEGQTLKGLELDPDNEKLKLLRGWTLQRRGRTSDVMEAEQVFRGLQNSRDFRVTLGLAEALERKGVAFSETARDIRSGKRVTQSPDPQARAEQFERDSRKAWDEALQNYKRTLERHAKDSNALNGAMRVTALLGREKESLAYADQLLEATDGDLEFWRQRLKRPQISVDEEDRFRDIVRKLTELEVSTHLHASTLLHKDQADGLALAHLDAAQQLAPDRPEIHSRRAELLKDLGRYDEAVAEIEAFLRVSKLPFDHQDIKRAWRMRTECEDSLRTARLGQ